MSGGSGRKWLGWWAKYDPDGCCWKTLTTCSTSTGEPQWETFLATWPRAGMTRSGIAYPLPPLVPLTSVTGRSLLPTPTNAVADTQSTKLPEHNSTGKQQLHLVEAVRLLPTPKTSDVNGIRSQDGKRGMDLRTIATLMIPTPRAHETGDYQYDGGDHTKPRPTLTGSARLVPSPVARDWKGQGREGQLGTVVAGMVPTPTADDTRPQSQPPSSSGQKRQVRLSDSARRSDGRRGRLNPRFVAWLMGFPLNWSEYDESDATRYQNDNSALTQRPAHEVKPQLEEYGNAVVPVVAEFIGQRIMAAEHLLHR